MSQLLPPYDIIQPTSMIIQPTSHQPSPHRLQSETQPRMDAEGYFWKAMVQYTAFCTFRKWKRCQNLEFLGLAQGRILQWLAGVYLSPLNSIRLILSSIILIHSLKPLTIEIFNLLVMLWNQGGIFQLYGFLLASSKSNITLDFLTLALPGELRDRLTQANTWVDKLKIG